MQNSSLHYLAILWIASLENYKNGISNNKFIFTWGIMGISIILNCIYLESIIKIVYIS